jgi:transcriptional regulator with XRE-family HTH domain
MTNTNQVSLITSFIGLGKSQVATIFGVSRQTLYDWLKGKIEPTGPNADRVGILSRAMASSCHGLRRPLYHVFVTEAPARGEASIIELLEQENWDERELTQAFEHARRLNDERAQQFGLGGPPASRPQGDNNQLDNSISHGLE